jgi:hypothetical protein
LITRQAAFGIYLITLYLVNAAALFSPFGFHNDYRAFERTSFFFHPETPHLLTIGRPLGAILLELQTMSITGMNGFLAYRVLSVLAVAGLSTALFEHVRKRFLISDSEAMAFVLAMALLPSMQISILWVSSSIPGIVSVVCAFVSYRALSQGKLWTAIGFAAGSLLIYHPGFLFFAVLALMELLLPRRVNQPVAQTAWAIIFIVAACALYFLFTVFVWKGLLVSFGPHYFTEMYERLAITQYSLTLGWNLDLKYLQVLSALGMTGSLWLASSSAAGAIVVVLAVLAVAVRVGWKYSARMLVLLGLIMSPIFTAPISFEVPYRTIFPEGAALIVPCMSFSRSKLQLFKTTRHPAAPSKCTWCLPRPGGSISIDCLIATFACYPLRPLPQWMVWSMLHRPIWALIRGGSP